MNLNENNDNCSSRLNEKLYNFKLNQALNFSCNLLYKNGSDEQRTYCGTCDSCQITTRLNSIKPWFGRASHITIKKFIFGLIKQIKNNEILYYLNDILKPTLDAKDFTYARNKFMPSCDEDHLKATNNRCLKLNDVEKCIIEISTWYSSASYYVKQNFLIGLFKECEHSILTLALLQIKQIIEAPRSESSISGANNRSRLRRAKQNGYVSTTDDSEFTDEEFNYDGTTDEEHDNYFLLDDFELRSLHVNTRMPHRAKHVDFIRQLPVYISKLILKSLDKKTLFNCSLVSKYWFNLVKELQKDSHLTRRLLDDMLFLRGTTSKLCNPRYANDVDVRVPNIKTGTFEIIPNENEKQLEPKSKDECTWEIAYSGISSRYVIMEERNVFCGSYNVLLLKEKRDPHRVAHLNGSNVVAVGTWDAKVRFIDLKTATDKTVVVKGHAGSIRCVYVCEAQNFVLTGSYDTSIRCWNLTSGKCTKIFQGHQNTVTCISLCDDQIVSGSQDKTCRVWSMRRKAQLRCFKQKNSVTSVAIFDGFCICGTYKGVLKMYQINTGTLVKVISMHHSTVTGIKFDKWHIVTCSNDGYALAFSAQGSHKKCLMAMRHPKAVLCIELQYLRAITGCADGKIRIWNILNGDCLRVMRGNSQCDPIYSISIYENRILINTEFNLILMEFEKVKWEYGSKRELEGENYGMENRDEETNLIVKKKRPYSAVRANRMEVVCTPNVKIFNDDRQSALSHSSGPVSEKRLKHAKNIQNPAPNLSRPASKLSIVTVNTPMTFATTPTLNKSALSYINVQSEINVEALQQKYLEPVVKPIEASSGKTTTDFSVINYKKLTLEETKLMLRSQLRNFKETCNNLSEKTFKYNDQLDTKSQMEPSMKRVEYPNSVLERPSSSPSKYDSKAKVKYYSKEVVNIINQSKADGDKKTDTENEKKFYIGTQSKENLLSSSKANMAETKPVALIKCNSAVKRVFETREFALQTNQGMYPINVSAKIPNPRVVSAVEMSRPPLAQKHTEQVRRDTLTSVKSEFKEAPKLERSQSELLMRKASAKPKTTVKVYENFETNKILSNDELKLMTYKEIDSIMNKMNTNVDDTKIREQKENEKLIKKLWLLKSTGVYHGSLLAKPKMMAPEIRE